MANDPLSLVRSGMIASMNTVESFFGSGAKMFNNVLGTFGLPELPFELPPFPFQKEETGFITTPDSPPLTFALPTPQDIMAPVGNVLGAVSTLDDDVEVF